MNRFCLRAALSLALILPQGFALAKTASSNQGNQSDRWNSRQILQVIERILKKPDAFNIKFVRQEKDSRSGKTDLMFLMRDNEKGEDYMISLAHRGGYLTYTILYVSGNKRVTFTGDETDVKPNLIYVTKSDRKVCYSFKKDNAECRREYLAAMDSLARLSEGK